MVDDAEKHPLITEDDEDPVTEVTDLLDKTLEALRRQRKASQAVIEEAGRTSRVAKSMPGFYLPELEQDG